VLSGPWAAMSTVLPLTAMAGELKVLPAPATVSVCQVDEPLAAQ